MQRKPHLWTKAEENKKHEGGKRQFQKIYIGFVPYFSREIMHNRGNGIKP